MSNVSKSSTDTFESIPQLPSPVQIKIIGQLNTIWFQKAKRYALIFAHHLPKQYAPPEIIPYLELEWNEYVQKQQRKYGGVYYNLRKPVFVYKDGELLGDEQDLLKFYSKTYQISVVEDFEAEAINHLKQYIDYKDRKHIFMLISIDNVYEGCLVFALYEDVCPITCTNFLRLAMRKQKGYSHAPIHRICKDSWVQFGGWKLKANKHNIPCENYAIPHDRRGVLSMCNDGKHQANSTQFFVTLNPTPWMDYLYCAFGQLVIGDDLLTKISRVETWYECPLQKIYICQSGLYSFYHVIPAEEEKLLKSVLQVKSEDTKVSTITVEIPVPASAKPAKKLDTLSDYLPDEQPPLGPNVYRLKDYFVRFDTKKSSIKSDKQQLKEVTKGPRDETVVKGDTMSVSEKKLHSKRVVKRAPKDVVDVRDVSSDFSARRYQKGMYTFNSEQ